MFTRFTFYVSLRRTVQALAAFGCLLSLSAFAQSGSRSWTGAVSTDYYDGANWAAAGDFPNGNVTFRDSALSGAANTTVDRSTGTYTYIYGLYFSNTLSTQNSYTINGPRQFFIGGTVIQTSAVTGGTLTNVINCNIQQAGTAENFNIGENHNLTVNGVIFGSNTLTKSGVGTLTLTGQNTSTGGLTVTGGTLSLTTGQVYSTNSWANRSMNFSGGSVIEVGGWADGDTTASKAGLGQVSFAQGNIVINNATIRYTGSSTSGNADRGFTIGAGGATLEAEGGNDFTLTHFRGFGIGTAAGGTLTLAGAQNGTFNHNLGGAGDVVKNGAGTWVISGANTYTGATNVNAGTLELNGSVGFNAGVIPSTSLTTVASGAELKVAANWNTQANDAVVLNGGTLNYTSGSSTDSTNYLNTITLNDGAQMTGNPVRLGWESDATLTVGGSSASTISSGFMLVNSNGSAPLRTTTMNVADATSDTNTDLAVSGVISNHGAPYHAAALTKTGAGTLVLSGANTYDGATTVSAGVLRLGNHSALGTTAGATTVNSGGELDCATYDPSGENMTISGTGTDGTGGRGALYSTGNNTSFGGGATITLAADAEIGGGGGRIDNSATIDGGGFNLTKVGTENWWNWSGSASNIDTLTVYTGQWLGFGNSALANAANDVHVMSNAEIMTWGSGHSFTSPMAFDDNARFRNYWGTGASRTSTHAISGDITLTGTVRFEDNGDILGRRTLTISGSIGGTGNFTKNGRATYIFSGATSNTLSGTTIINNGSLTLSKTGGAVAVAGNLAVYSDNTHSARVWPTADNQLGGASTVLSGDRSQGGLPAFALNGTTQSLAGIDSTIHDNLMIANSATSFGGLTPGNSGTGTVNLVGSGAYVFNGYFWNDWGGGGTIAVTVNMTGAGNQTLQGDQINYTGATAVNSGQLILSGASNYRSATTVENGAVLTWTHTTNLSNSQTGKTILLKDGSTLQNTNPNQWIVFNGASGATTVDTGASVIINHTSNATAAAGRGFYLDSGLKSTGGDTTATVTINTTNAGSGVNLRNNNTTFAGTLIVNGIANATAYSGSGIGAGGNTTGLQNADIQLNGTMELQKNGIGWANTGSAANTFQMGALSGTGVMVGNHDTAGGNVTVTLGNTGNDGTFSGQIADGTNNTTSITKVGGGTQTLSGTSTNSGLTTVSAGTLSVTGTTGSGGVSVASGATLAGTGNIGGAVTIGSGGTLSPGL